MPLPGHERLSISCALQVLCTHKQAAMTSTTRGVLCPPHGLSLPATHTRQDEAAGSTGYVPTFCDSLGGVGSDGRGVASIHGPVQEVAPLHVGEHTQLLICVVPVPTAHRNSSRQQGRQAVSFPDCSLITTFFFHTSVPSLPTILFAGKHEMLTPMHWSGSGSRRRT
jgi:hypothetical protein